MITDDLAAGVIRGGARRGERPLIAQPTAQPNAQPTDSPAALRAAPLATEKLLPQNVDAEAAVLGSLLIDPDALEQIGDVLRPEDFYREAHRIVYTAICDLYDAGVRADLITLTDELQRSNTLEEVGGASFVSSLTNSVPTSANIESYARIVTRTATLRRLIGAAGKIAGVAYHEPDDDVALDVAEEFITQVRAQRRGGAQVARLDDDMHELVQFIAGGIAAGEAGRSLLGVATGMRELDKLLGGFKSGDFILLAARPRTGKSAMMLNFALAAAQPPDPQEAQEQPEPAPEQAVVLICSLEMAREQLAMRLCAMTSGVDLAKLQQPHSMTEDELAAALTAAGELERLRDTLIIDDTPAQTLAQIRARARAVAREAERRGARLELVIIDYVQFIADGSASDVGGSSGGWRRSENRVQALGQITQGLKNLARELGVAVLGLAQLSRAIEQRADKTPLLSDLRESGSLENDADVVLFLHRDEVFNPDSDRKHIADVIVAKHRNGRQGSVSLYWDGAHQRFRDLELQHTLPDMPRGYD